MICEFSLNLIKNVLDNLSLAGLLKHSSKYRVLSNRESGDGRPDLILKTPSVRGGAIVLELKTAKRF